MIPGEVFVANGYIEINANRGKVAINITNSGDRPVQVGSHYHFYEVNPALLFDRKKAYGYRLDIAAGTAIRFEPGQSREVSLTELLGERKVFGFRGEVGGDLGEKND